MSDRPTWNEESSQQFLSFSDIITPSRREQMEMLAGLIPADQDQPFQVVELGCGGGELAALVLERFPKAQYLGLDGSATMLEAAGKALAPFGRRAELRPFCLEQPEVWVPALPRPIRCIFSSLVVHHLTDAEKQALYRTAAEILEPGGALLLIDIVLPRSPRAVDALRRNWDDAVRQQSQGVPEAYAKFRAEGWNYYAAPDPIDLPAPLYDQLKWMEQAGFRNVDCFWQRAGHALFGGYR